MHNFDNEFDKIFAKGLKEPDPSVPSDREWAKLAKKLERPNKSRYWWLWLLLPFLLALLGWGAFTIIHLKQQVDSFANIHKSESTIISDTIYRTFVNYDTIFKTVYINRNVRINELPYLTNSSLPTSHNVSSKIIEENSSNQPATLKPARIDSEASNPRLSASTGGTDDPKPSNNEDISIKGGNTILDESIKNPDVISDGSSSTADKVENSSNISQVSKSIEENHNSSDGVKVNYDQITLTNTAVNKDERSFLRKLSDNFRNEVMKNEPLGWRLGTSIGVGHPLGLSNQEITKSIVVGLNAEALLGSDWAIVPALKYVSYDSKLSEVFSDRLLIPTPKSQGDNYLFYYVEGYYKYWIPSLSLRYRVRSSSLFSGYLGMGIAANLFQKVKLEYEFLEKNTGEELKYYLDYKIKNRFSFVTLQAGTSYNITNKLAFYGDLDSYFDLRAKPKFLPFMSLSLGVKYLIY